MYAHTLTNMHGVFCKTLQTGTMKRFITFQSEALNAIDFLTVLF